LVLNIHLLDNYKKLSKFYSRIFITRILIIGLNFLTVALLIKKIGDTDYGIYITIYSIINWVFLLDIGVGKGMRNKLTELIEINDNYNARKLISTTILISTSLSVLFILIFVLTGIFVDLDVYFIDSNSSIFSSTLNVFFSVIILKLIFGNLDQILFSLQYSHVTVYITFSIAIIFYLSLYTISFIGINLNYFQVSVLYFLAVLISYISFSFWFFIKNNKFIPSIKSIDLSLFKSLISSGLKIFVVQLLFFLLLALDKFIILKYFNGESVTSYDIVYRVMTLLLFPFSIIAQPLWSSYAAAKVNKDSKWINKIIKRLYLFSIMILFGVIFLSFFFDFITHIWIGKIYDISYSLKLLVGILLFNVMWATMHSDILYGFSSYSFMGKTVFIGLLLKLIILIILIYTNHLSISNIVITSIIGYSFFSFIAPFYVKKQIKKIK
jgi:O-antigen/teichoic acid export membrane protein